MAWPNTPLTTYVATTVPAIKASDLNSIQSAINSIINAAYSLKGLWIDGTGGAVETTPASHVVCTGTAPTFSSFGTGAGTSPVNNGITGTDTAGRFTMLSGTTPTAGGTVVTISFAQAYGVAPAIVVSGVGATAQNNANAITGTATTTQLIITMAGTAALAGSQPYAFGWVVIGLG